MNAIESLKFFLPETFLLIGGFGILLLDLFIKNKKILGILSLLILIASAFLTRIPTGSLPLFFGYFTLDTLTHFFRLTAFGIVAITILASLAYKNLDSRYEGEYYSLFLFMTFALVLVAASTNLLMAFLNIEFVSVVSYLLVGFQKKDPLSKEAAIKYFLFGSVASGLMLYGMSLLYGAAGSLDFVVIQKQISNPSFFVVSIISMTLIMAGLGFKISMAPFHMWAPDVYEAAPTPVTAFLTVGPKALGFAVIIRILSTSFSWIGWKWQIMIIFLSILTMTIGNIVAIAQVNIKRLLAYSSIAQAGYILMGIAVFGETGLSGVLIYLLAYAFTNLGAFIVVIAVANHFGNDDLQSYAGLAKRSPVLAASLTLFLLSLAGIPPLAGFIGKFFVFSSAIEGKFIVLAVAAAINSAIAAFYYFKIVRLMYLTPSVTEERIENPLALNFALFITLAGTLIMGLLPSPFIAFVKEMLPL